MPQNFHELNQPMQTLPTCHIAIILALASALACCASAPAIQCGAAQQAAIQDTLYFGTGIPDGGVVTPDAWSTFLAEVVTPRFPQGLTVAQAAGQWRGDNGAIVQEDSYVLQLVHSGDAANAQSVVEIIDAYKMQFRQEAVLRVSERACISF